MLGESILPMGEEEIVLCEVKSGKDGNALEGQVKKLEAQCTVLKRELERQEKTRCVPRKRGGCVDSLLQHTTTREMAKGRRRRGGVSAVSVHAFVCLVLFSQTGHARKIGCDEILVHARPHHVEHHM